MVNNKQLKVKKAALKTLTSGDLKAVVGGAFPCGAGTGTQHR